MDRFNGLDIPESLADALEPSTLALVVYDMQVGILSQIDGADRVLANVLRVLDAARERGVRTLFLRHYFMPTELAGVFQLRQARSEEHTSELQSHRDLHSFPTRRSSDLAARPRRGPRARRPHAVPAPLLHAHRARRRLPAAPGQGVAGQGPRRRHPPGHPAPLAPVCAR